MTTRGLSDSEAAPTRGTAAVRADDQSHLRLHRPSERPYRVQSDPVARRCRDAHVRCLAGRALPGRPRLELRDRHRPGGSCEARARQPRDARRADGGGRPRRRVAAHPGGRGGRGRPRAARRRRRRRRGRRVAARQRAHARRVDPHRRIAPDDSQAGRDGPLGLVRRRRSRRAAGRNRRGRQLCRPRDGRGARIPPPAVPTRACAEQAPAHARRRDRPARPRPRLGPLGA